MKDAILAILTQFSSHPHRGPWHHGAVVLAQSLGIPASQAANFAALIAGAVALAGCRIYFARKRQG